MSDENPYSTPHSLPSDHLCGEGRFSGMSFEEVKKLYKRSRGVNGFVVLLFPNLVLLILYYAFFEVFLEFRKLNDKDLIVGFIVCAVFVIAFFGVLMRSVWGRIAGVVSCLSMLVSFPIGTIIGITGLWDFWKAPELFGNDRVHHKDLKAEYERLRNLFTS